MKRLFVSLLALAGIAFVGSLSASTLPIAYSGLNMRNTSASSTAREANWGKVGQSPPGFVDSTVFRRTTSGTAYDTSVVFYAQSYPLPPNIEFNPAALGDTLVPWIFLRVRQDSVSYAWSGAVGSAAADSVRFAVEHSPDNGVTWFSCSGTPTFRFDTIYMTSGQDGLQSPTLIGVEGSLGEDSWTVPIKASYPKIPGAYIVNQNLPYLGEPLRVIVGMRATGQFKLEVGHWTVGPGDDD